MGLKKCEIVVVLPRGEAGLKIDQKTVRSGQAPANVKIERRTAASSELKGAGALGVGPSGATGSASMAASAERTRSLTAATSDVVPVLLGTRSRTKENDQSWRVTRTDGAEILQGMLWQQGYQHGDFKGHVYDDAAKFLHRWNDRGLRLYVYSSGSVQAQKLIFGFSNAGDLTPCFSGYFDTRMGAKREPEAYQNILNKLGVEAKTVLFLSDVEAELEAAEAVGMKTAWLVRDESAPPSARPQLRDFSEVDELLKR